MLRAHVRRSVRAGLAGVWVQGGLPPGGAVLAGNHHSWWDGYLHAELAWAHGAPFAVLMHDAGLRRHPYLRELGAMSPRALRPALRALRGGTWLSVFPEGGISPPGAPRPLQPGAPWLARQAGVPLVPVAGRVLLRGGQWPEAYLRLGPPLEANTLPALRAALDRELAVIERLQADCNPEEPLPGFLRLTGGRVRDDRRLQAAGERLQRLLGHGGVSRETARH